MPEMMVLAAVEGASNALDFSDILTTCFQGMQSDFLKYVAIAAPIAVSIWAGPKIIKIVMRFFSALTH